MTIFFLYLPIAFTLMVTVLNYKQFLKRMDNYRAFLLYFSCFFFLFLVVPFLMVFISGTNLTLFLQQIGFSWGKISTGIIFIAAGIPVNLLIAFIVSKDSKIKQQYPFSKKACDKLSRFFVYESAYFILYYFAWEFLFRGLLFFPLLYTFNLGIALSVQTTISTLYHIGHPDTELFAALAGGFIFGIIAYLTGSFLYTIFIHAFLGISTDTFLYIRYYRKK